MSDTLTNGLNGTVPPMPGKIATAICGVMAEVPALQKGEKNTHGNYNFASIDDFLEAVRPLCAKHKLIIVQQEAHEELRTGETRDGKTQSWLFIQYDFILISGDETWQLPLRRTSMVNATMGSQAMGACQSYALKMLMRSLFQIATGEYGQDLDEFPKGEIVGKGAKAPPKKEPPAPFFFVDRYGEENPEPMTEEAFYSSILNELKDCAVYDAVGQVMQNNDESLRRLNMRRSEVVDAAYKKRCRQLRAELAEAHADEAQTPLDAG